MEEVNLSVASRQKLANAIDKSVINCGMCSKSFLTRRDYNRHRKTHDQPYHCALCPKKYALKTDLERHGAQHENNSARFHCAWPGCAHVGSVRKDNLLKHMNRKHLDVNREGSEIRKTEVLRLYKRAIENEKVLAAQRTKKLTLLEAVQSGDESIVQHLLDSWASTQVTDTPVALPLSEAILIAARDGNMSLLLLLIAKGASVDAEDWNHNTPLLLAADNGHYTVVKHLVEKGAAVDAGYFASRTPLLVAAMKGHETVVKYLVEKGAAVDAGDWISRTPLLVAAEEGHETVVKYLLEKGAAVDAGDWISRTPLLVAAEKGHKIVVKYLLEKGAAVDAGGIEDVLAFCEDNGIRLLPQEHAARIRAITDSRIL